MFCGNHEEENEEEKKRSDELSTHSLGLGNSFAYIFEWYRSSSHYKCGVLIFRCCGNKTEKCRKIGVRRRNE